MLEAASWAMGKAVGHDLDRPAEQGPGDFQGGRSAVEQDRVAIVDQGRRCLADGPLLEGRAGRPLVEGRHGPRLGRGDRPPRRASASRTPARSRASRSRRTVLSETPSDLTSSSSVANPWRAIRSRSIRRLDSASMSPFLARSSHNLSIAFRARHKLSSLWSGYLTEFVQFPQKHVVSSRPFLKFGPTLANIRLQFGLEQTRGRRRCPSCPRSRRWSEGSGPPWSGKFLADVTVHDPFLLQGGTAEEFERKVNGASVRLVSRRGKWVVIELDRRQGDHRHPAPDDGRILADPARPARAHPRDVRAGESRRSGLVLRREAAGQGGLVRRLRDRRGGLRPVARTRRPRDRGR